MNAFLVILQMYLCFGDSRFGKNNTLSTMSNSQNGTDLRCNSERENECDTHHNSKSVQGTRKNPRLNPDEYNDLEEDYENEDLSDYYQSGKGTCKTIEEKS